jgi:2-dehydro-3-deoxyphosphogluconate aldolase/(4S)-4-hydroxy-2-oxoglutarate aldolase
VDIAGIVALAPVIPVLTIERAADALPLARALVKGGLRVLEITLRTSAAFDALAAIVDQVPEAIAGVGTVLTVQQFEQAQRAGARFAVSPGCTPALAAAAGSAGLPYLPGVQTVSEAMALAEQGFNLLKLFPADAAGGITWLRAVAAPLPDIRFCPTGGVAADAAPAYLALANVACVGGSWVTPKEAVAGHNRALVERLAFMAAALKRL